MFPQVGGHEIVGKIVAVGAEVKHLALGTNVGVGWYKSACGHCESCMSDYHSLCPSIIPTCAGGNKGGFAEAIRVPADYAFPIPEGLPLQLAGPLLCGGITVYSPLVEYDAVAKHVGVVGIGGLGSMAIQFARARGNHVTALSSSIDKIDLVKSLGAHAFVNTKDADAFKAAADSLDLIIVTVGAPVDFSSYLTLLKRNGTIVFVGAAQSELRIPIFGELLLKQLRVAGSATGGRKCIQDMLLFATEHKVYPLVEEFAFADINKAMEAVDANKVRFRAVLKW